MWLDSKKKRFQLLCVPSTTDNSCRISAVRFVWDYSHIKRTNRSGGKGGWERCLNSDNTWKAFKWQIYRLTHNKILSPTKYKSISNNLDDYFSWTKRKQLAKMSCISLAERPIPIINWWFAFIKLLKSAVHGSSINWIVFCCNGCPKCT